MPVLPTDPTVHRRPLTLFPSHEPEYGTGLRVEREHIDFFNVAPGRVHIQVTVHNDGDRPSVPAPMDVEVAAFGAFLPWAPLTRLQVPSLEPGGLLTVHTEVEQARLEALTATAQPPRRPLLEAPAGLELPDDDDTGPFALTPRQLEVLRSMASAGGAVRIEPMSERNYHWIGNLNIFLGPRPVERHLARALRIYPGRKNAAMFCVGSGSDEYAFSVEATLTDYVCLRRDVPAHAPVIPLAQWTSLGSFPVVFLVLDIPDFFRECEVAVHVRQRSTGAEAVVEFSMDAEAQGSGCYVI